MKSESEDSLLPPEINELAPDPDPDLDFQYPDTPTTTAGPSSQQVQLGGGRGGAHQREFQAPRALKASRMTSYSAKHLYDDIQRGSIDLNPEYQRDVVWNAEKQMGLIDSVWAQIYIPPVIFLVQYDGYGGETKICLDGKQRLTSIQRFMDGAIPYKHPTTNEKWWYKNPASTIEKSGKSTRLLLPDKARAAFANRQVYCVEYQELDDDDEREIFRRVQLGVALSTAEKLHVINTPRSQFIRELLSQYSSSPSSGTPGLTSFPWDRKRGADFRCFAQAVYCLFKWSSQTNSNPTSKAKTVSKSDFKNLGSLPQLEKWLGAVSDNSEMTRDDEDDAYGESLPESFVGKVKETFEVMVRLANENEFSRPFYSHKKVSPVEIIAVSLLVYVHHVLPTSPQAKFTLGELSAAFAMMRTDVRKYHADVRLNDKCGKTLVQFVKDVRKEAVREVVRQGAGTGTGTERQGGQSVGRVPVQAESASVSVPVNCGSVQGQQMQHVRTQLTPSQSQSMPTSMPQQTQTPQFAPQPQPQSTSTPMMPQPQSYWPRSQPQPRPQSRPQPQPHSQPQPQSFRTNTGFTSSKLIIPPGPAPSTSIPIPISIAVPTPITAPNTLKRSQSPSDSDANPSQVATAKRPHLAGGARTKVMPKGSLGGPAPNRVPSPAFRVGTDTTLGGNGSTWQGRAYVLSSQQQPQQYRWPVSGAGTGAPGVAAIGASLPSSTPNQGVGPVYAMTTLANHGNRPHGIPISRSPADTVVNTNTLASLTVAPTPPSNSSLPVPPQTPAAGRVSASAPTAASQAPQVSQPSHSKQELLEQLEMNELLAQTIPLPLPPSTPGNATGTSSSSSLSSSAIIPPSSSFSRTALEQRKRMEEGSQFSMLAPSLSMSQWKASSHTLVSQSPSQSQPQPQPVGAVAPGSQIRRPSSTAPAPGSGSTSSSSPSSSSQPLWTSKPL